MRVLGIVFQLNRTPSVSSMLVHCSFSASKSRGCCWGFMAGSRSRSASFGQPSGSSYGRSKNALPRNGATRGSGTGVRFNSVNQCGHRVARTHRARIRKSAKPRLRSIRPPPKIFHSNLFSSQSRQHSYFAGLQALSLNELEGSSRWRRAPARCWAPAFEVSFRLS